MKTLRKFWPALLSAGCLACSEGTEQPDASTSSDASSPDAGTLDAATSDSGPVDAGETIDYDGLVINEVAAAGSPADWFELYNTSAHSIDLSGVRFTDDLAATFKASFSAGTTIGPGQYLVQEVSDASVGFGLGNSEELGIFTPAGAQIDQVDWENDASPLGRSYGRIPNGIGEFQTLDTPTPGEANLPNAASTCGDGTITGREVCDGSNLGGASCASLGFESGALACASTCLGFDSTACVSAAPKIAINEVSSDGDDLIELFNADETTVSLQGWWISDTGYVEGDPNTASHRYDFVATTSIASSGFLVLTKGIHHPFGLGGEDSLTLRDQLGRVVDQVSWTTDQAVPSLARVPDGTGAFVTTSSSSFGRTNL